MINNAITGPFYNKVINPINQLQLVKSGLPWLTCQPGRIIYIQVPSMLGKARLYSRSRMDTKSVRRLFFWR